MNKVFEALKTFFEWILIDWIQPDGLTTVESVGFYITAAIGLIFTLCYTYQFFYVFIAFVFRPRKYPDCKQDKRYAVLIAARNEEKVIPELLKSIRRQTYPAELIDIYVVADNCDEKDRTAAVSRELGAIVYERQNKELVGKGYALELLLNNIKAEKGLRAYDAYLVFDADNVLRDNYFEEINKAYSAGNKILTTYRNSKNYGANWISAGYSLWFMREARHLNNARSILGTSAAISGTGFLVDSEIIERNGGWKHFLLTEDIEFTVDMITQGERVGYCHKAEFFDEQPETFKQSWRQRLRWSKGMFQVFRNYGGRLLKGSLKLKWSCYDMTMNIMPAFIMSSIQIVSILVLYILNLLLYGQASKLLVGYLGEFLLYGYGIFFLLGFFAFLTEWKKIHCNKFKAILLLFTFPLFMLTYIPISIVAFFSRKVTWKPVEHKYAMSASDIEKE